MSFRCFTNTRWKFVLVLFSLALQPHRFDAGSHMHHPWKYPQEMWAHMYFCSLSILKSPFKKSRQKAPALVEERDGDQQWPGAGACSAGPAVGSRVWAPPFPPPSPCPLSGLSLRCSSRGGKQLNRWNACRLFYSRGLLRTRLKSWRNPEHGK